MENNLTKNQKELIRKLAKTIEFKPETGKTSSVKKSVKRYRLDVEVKQQWTFAVEASSITEAYAALDLKERGYEPKQIHILVEDGIQETKFETISDLSDENWEILKNSKNSRESFYQGS